MKTNTSAQKELSPRQRDALLAGLKARFERNLSRHERLDWAMEARSKEFVGEGAEVYAKA